MSAPAQSQTDLRTQAQEAVRVLRRRKPRLDDDAIDLFQIGRAHV